MSNHPMEDAFTAVACNPVSAATAATLRVLSNPFRVERKSFSTYYARNRQYSLMYEKIDTAVRECPECDANKYGVTSSWHRAGEKAFLSKEIYDKDTFCAEHKSQAMKAQRIYLNS